MTLEMRKTPYSWQYCPLLCNLLAQSSVSVIINVVLALCIASCVNFKIGKKKLICMIYLYLIACHEKDLFSNYCLVSISKINLGLSISFFQWAVSLYCIYAGDP
jgi:hypothetical protein